MLVATVLIALAASATSARAEEARTLDAVGPTIAEDGLPVEPWRTGLELQPRIVLSQLAPLLRQSDLEVIEFFHERPSPDPAVGAESGGYYGEGLPLAEQVDSYTAVYQADYAGEEPLVVALVVAGRVSCADLGPLRAFVSGSVQIAPGGSVSTAQCGGELRAARSLSGGAPVVLVIASAAIASLAVGLLVWLARRRSRGVTTPPPADSATTDNALRTGARG